METNRPSLSDWEDKITAKHFPAFQHTGFKAFKSWPSHKKYLANFELEALEEFHKQEVKAMREEIENKDREIEYLKLKIKNNQRSNPNIITPTP